MPLAVAEEFERIFLIVSVLPDDSFGRFAVQSRLLMIEVSKLKLMGHAMTPIVQVDPLTRQAILVPTTTSTKYVYPAIRLESVSERAANPLGKPSLPEQEIINHLLK